MSYWPTADIYWIHLAAFFGWIRYLPGVWLPDIANKITGCPVKFEFQINNVTFSYKHFGTYFYQKSFTFIWNLNWGVILSGTLYPKTNQLNQISFIYKWKGRQRMALLESVSVLDMSWIFLQRSNMQNTWFINRCPTQYCLGLINPFYCRGHMRITRGYTGFIVPLVYFSFQLLHYLALACCFLYC